MSKPVQMIGIYFTADALPDTNSNMEPQDYKPTALTKELRQPIREKPYAIIKQVILIILIVYYRVDRS